MDRLPPELLGMITDAIEEDPLRLRGQRTLAALARTHKLFYSICRPRLYGTPTLKDEKMLEKWSRYYLSRVNPWTICQGTKGLEDIAVPKKITLDHPAAHSKSRVNLVNRYRSFRPCPLVKTPFTAFLFRNLTSLSVSTKSAVAEDFAATLLHPRSSNRSSLQELTLDTDETSHLSYFLFDAFNRFPELWLGWDSGLIGELVEALGTSSDRERIKERWDEDDDLKTLLDEDWDQLHAVAISLAPTRYSIFRTMYVDGDLPEDALRGITRTRDLPCSPFDKITKLTTTIDDSIDLHLILNSHLFPSLHTLKIIGAGLVLSYPKDVKLLRHSVHEIGGSVRLPTLAEGVSMYLPTTFDLAEFSLPLTSKEVSEEPRIDFYGPNLTMLDMSELTLL